MKPSSDPIERGEDERGGDPSEASDGTEVTEELDTVRCESREAALQRRLAAFSEHLTTEGVERFWPDRPPHPELNGNGVTQEELIAKVDTVLRAHIAKSLHDINGLVLDSRDPEIAFETVSALLQREATEFAGMLYESLVYFKKIGIDELTGLSNRTVFDRNLATGVERNKRFGDGFSIVLFDLDHFKDVNDTYGHEAGDAVLQEMARRLRGVKIRGLDALARIGGEEFAIILPSTPKEGACILAERISDHIGSEPFRVTTRDGEQAEVRVTASIGVSEYTNAARDPGGKKVLRQADTCLYVLKGTEPDDQGATLDRRGGIACDGHVLTASDLSVFRAQMSTQRSSFPEPSLDLRLGEIG